jgi:hypothetical protein
LLRRILARERRECRRSDPLKIPARTVTHGSVTLLRASSEVVDDPEAGREGSVHGILMA